MFPAAMHLLAREHENDEQQHRNHAVMNLDLIQKHFLSALELGVRF